MASRFLTAVIANATTPPGMACAHHLAGAGFDLILVDRDRGALNAFADALTTRTRQSVEVIATDLTNTVQRRALTCTLLRDESIAVLIHVEDTSAAGEPVEPPGAEATIFPTPASPHAALVTETLSALVTRGDTPDVFRASVILF